MFRVIVGTVTVANLPDRQRASILLKDSAVLLKKQI